MCTLVNTTFHVHRAIDAEFHQWLVDSLLPSVKRIESFSDVLAMKILIEVSEDANSYAVQFRASDEAIAHNWREDILPALMRQLTLQYGDEAVLYFTTYMEIMYRQ